MQVEEISYAEHKRGLLSAKCLKGELVKKCSLKWKKKLFFPPKNEAQLLANMNKNFSLAFFSTLCVGAQARLTCTGSTW